MNYTPQTQVDCGSNCNPCGTFSLPGCAGGIPYMQLSAIGGEATAIQWINLETGDIVTEKPAGFLTGECSDPSNIVMVFTGAEADPNAENVTGGATELDNMTYLQIDNDTGVVASWKYSATEGAWILQTPAAPVVPVHVSETQLSTASQTEFTLANTPVGSVIVTRNGVDISDSFTFVGAVGTYAPADNFDCVFDADDKVQFHYEAVV